MIAIKTSYYTIALLEPPEIPIDLLWKLAVIFGFISIAYLVGLFVIRNRQGKRQRSTAERKKELAPMISQFLFFEADADKEEKKEYIEMKIHIRELIKVKENRKVLSEILRDLNKDVSGDARDRLCTLYTDMDLHTDAFALLDSWRWEIISAGITELTEMQVVEAYGFIRKFINDRRGIIRKQAQIATVTLKPEGIAYFLDTARYRISEWQQLTLLDVLRQKENFTPPLFKNWLISQNKDVVQFALRLLRYYNQTNAGKELVALVRHRSQNVRLEAVQCIRKFRVEDAMEVMKSFFSRSNREVKLAILDAISEMGNKSDIKFLENIGKQENDFVIKTKTLSTINRIVPDSVLPAEDLIPIEEPLPETENEEGIETIVSRIADDEATSEMEAGDPEKPEESLWNQIQKLIHEDQESSEPQIDLGEIRVEVEPEDQLAAESDYVETTVTMAGEQKKQPKTKSMRSGDFYEHANDNGSGIPQGSAGKQPMLPNDNPDFHLSGESESISESFEDGKDNSVGDDLAGTEDFETPDNGKWNEWLEDETPTIEASKTEIDMDKLMNTNFNPESALAGFKLNESEPLPEAHASLFYDLMKRCDLDEKLMLLDEILLIGDAKEIPLLQDLLKDKSKQLSRKALFVLDGLQERLRTAESRLQTAYMRVPGEGHALMNFELESDFFRQSPEAEREQVARTIKRSKNTLVDTFWNNIRSLLDG